MVLSSILVHSMPAYISCYHIRVAVLGGFSNPAFSAIFLVFLENGVRYAYVRCSNRDFWVIGQGQISICSGKGSLGLLFPVASFLHVPNKISLGSIAREVNTVHYWYSYICHRPKRHQRNNCEQQLHMKIG